MKKKIYIETSVISYYTAKPSENIRTSGHQLATFEFWELLPQFEVYISDTVIEESSRGDEMKVQDRLFAIRDFAVLEIDTRTQKLANMLLKNEAIPAKFPEDALHIAIAAIHGIDFILTWNFKHINNPFMMRKIADVVLRADYPMPVICSPEEFVEAEHE
jgi:predicted nucleic acid-binding protein